MHSVRCVPSEHGGGKGFGGWLQELAKTLGKTEPLKGNPEWSREVSAFHETGVEGR